MSRSSRTLRTIVSRHAVDLGRRDDPPVVQELAHVLGRELDRRERVLDLVRDRPRHLRPRGELIALHEARHVVEQDERARPPAGGIGKRHADDAQAHAGRRLPGRRPRSAPRRRWRRSSRARPRRRGERRPRASAGTPSPASSASAAGLIVTILSVGVGRDDAGRRVAEQGFDVVASPDRGRRAGRRARRPCD